MKETIKCTKTHRVTPAVLPVGIFINVVTKMNNVFNRVLSHGIAIRIEISKG